LEGKELEEVEAERNEQEGYRSGREPVKRWSGEYPRAMIAPII